MTINPFRCFTSFAAVSVALLQQSNDWTLTNRAPLVNWWPKTGWAYPWGMRHEAWGTRHATTRSSSYKFDSSKRFRFRFLVFVCPHFLFLVSRFATLFTFSFAIVFVFLPTVYRCSRARLFVARNLFTVRIGSKFSSGSRDATLSLSLSLSLTASHCCNLLVKYCH